MGIRHILIGTGLLVCAATGCGGVAHRTGAPVQEASTGEETTTIVTKAIPPGQSVRGDGDADNPGDVDGNGDIDTRTTPTDRATSDADNDTPTPDSYRYPDHDDNGILAHGRVPAAPQGRLIAATVGEYYRRARGLEGTTACAMLAPWLSRTAPEAYGSGAGPRYMRGTTCSAVMYGLFHHKQPELAEPVRVLAVRASGRHAQVVVGSRSMRASYIGVERVGGGWALSQIYGHELP